MTEIASLLPYVVPYAPGVSEPVAKRALVEALDQFCRESWYYTQDLDAQLILGTDTIVGTFGASPSKPITVNAIEVYPIITNGVHQYVIQAPTDMRPYQITSIHANDRVILPVTAALAREAIQVTQKKGDPKYYTHGPSSIARVFPSLVEAAEMAIQVAFTPVSNANELPDILFDEYRQVLCDGALSMLYAHPNQSYSDNKGVIFSSAKFHAGINNAKIRTSKGHSPATATARARPWV